MRAPHPPQRAATRPACAACAEPAPGSPACARADDRLNWNLEAHPRWIAKAPGTFASTFERNLTYEAPLGMSPMRRPFTADWDARFLVANCLSSDPVTNGHRKGLHNRRGTCCGNMSPTRSWEER